MRTLIPLLVVALCWGCEQRVSKRSLKPPALDRMLEHQPNTR